jgi:glycosyltransferase involved in cell wall biosynthesis
LASVASQSRAVDELIVVDDQSSDGSADLALARGATVVNTPPPGGPSAARNIGWRTATSDAVAFLDADDRWLPHHVEVVTKLLDDHPEAVLAFGGLELFGLATGRYAHHLPSGGPVDARIQAALDCVVPQMAVIVRRDALAAVGGYDETLRVAEDFDLFARLARLGPFVGAVPVTAEYRQHPAQVTRARGLEVALAAITVRHRNWLALRGEVAPADLARLETHALAEWNRVMRAHWRAGNRKALYETLAMHAFVPGSDALTRRWRTRARFGWYPWYTVLITGRTLRLRRLWNATIGRFL